MNLPTIRQPLLLTPLFSVERRTYTRTDGGRFERDVVVHPGAVVILPLLDGPRVVMIRNYRYSVERELLELPAGTREPNELLVVTAHRELEEETGYRAESMIPLVEFFPSPGMLSERMYVFVARGLSFVGQRLQENEKITVETFDLPAVRRMLIDRTLEDGKSIAALGTFLLQHSA